MRKTRENQKSNPDPYEDMVRIEKLDPYEKLIKLPVFKRKNKSIK